MIPWELVDCGPGPEGTEELRLYRRRGEFSIRVGGRELMNSRVHGSEEAMAELACRRIAGRRCPRVLIGGLGMGYTAAAALRTLGPKARVVIAELVPAVVAWNRGPLAEMAGRPLWDPRLTVREVDVAAVLRADRGAYDAVLLDVDNGPVGLTRQGNGWIYGPAGLAAARDALRPAGVLAVWSAGPDPAFARRLRRAGLDTEEVRFRARGSAGGRRHTIWLAWRPEPASSCGRVRDRRSPKASREGRVLPGATRGDSR